IRGGEVPTTRYWLTGLRRRLTGVEAVPEAEAFVHRHDRGAEAEDGLDPPHQGSARRPQGRLPRGGRAERVRREPGRRAAEGRVGGAARSPAGEWQRVRRDAGAGQRGKDDPDVSEEDRGRRPRARVGG